MSHRKPARAQSVQRACLEMLEHRRLLSGVVSDEFDAGIDTDVWTEVNPKGDAVFSTENERALISVPGGLDHSVWKAEVNNSARIMQEVSNDDMIIEAKFDSIPGRDAQQGLIFEQDGNDFLRFDVYSNARGLLNISASVVNGTVEESGEIVGLVKQVRVEVDSQPHMRVERKGDTWTLYYSYEGESWYEAVVFEHPITVCRVGVFAGNQGGRKVPAFTAAVDYFRNASLTANPLPIDLIKAPGISVDEFGATGDGVTDDTGAIQNAIDSVRSGIAGMNAQDVAGGIVYFPPGIYRTSSPLLLTSGVSLLGTRDAVIHNVSEDSQSSAIELVANHPDVRYAWASSIESLTIHTAAAYGIAAEKTGLVLLNARFEDLEMSAGNWAIYLPADRVYTQNSLFQDIHVRDFGAGALWVEGNANRLRGICTEGTARPTLQPLSGLVRVIGTGNAIEDCIIGGVPASVAATAFHVSGQIYWRNNSHALAQALGGVAYRFEGLGSSDLDALNGLRADARALFSDSHGIVVGHVALPLGQDLDAVLIADGRSAIRVQQVSTAAGAALEANSRGGLAGRYFAVSAKAFGAKGDGIADDTAALQLAIDTASAERTAVFLPRGRYLTTAPLRLGSNTTLIGEGSGTVLFNVSGDRSAGALEITGAAEASSIAIRELKIYTETGYAIRARGDSVLSIDGLQISNLIVSAGNWAVYLPASQARSLDGVFENLQMLNSGGGALWVDGDRNRIDAVNTESGVRAGFAAEPAMIRVGGDGNRISGCIVEGIPAAYPVVAYYITGSNVQWAHNWAETGSALGGVAFWFDQVNGMQADGLKHLTSTRRAKFTQSTGIRFQVIDLNAELVDLTGSLDVDGESRIRIQEVVARFDPGHLDDPRFTIGGFWNSTNGSYVDVGTLNAGSNLLTNGDFRDGLTGWMLTWGAGMKARL